MTPETCPHCGARVIDREASGCWRCNASFPGAGSAAKPQPPPTASAEAHTSTPPPLSSPEHGLRAGEPPKGPRRSAPLVHNPVVAAVAGLVLLFGIVAFGWFNAGGLFVVVVLTSVPVLVRALVGSQRRPISGKPSPTPGGKVLYVLTTLTLVTLLVIASGVAFFVTCTAVGFGGFALLKDSSIHSRSEFGGWIILITAVIAGVTAAILTSVVISRFLWPTKD